MIYRTAEEWERFLGEQLRASRLRQNMTQEELASRAGVSVPTVARLENGGGSSLATFIRALKVLREDSWLEHVAPSASIDPVQIHRAGAMRQRARGSRSANDRAIPPRAGR